MDRDEGGQTDQSEMSRRLADSLPAATLIVMRPAPDGGPDEILVVERARGLAFAGGRIAFPGGRVEEQDEALARGLGHDAPNGEIAARIAALRETFEETGLLCGVRQDVPAAAIADARAELLDGAAFGSLLSERGWTLDPMALTAYARWCPPAGVPIPRRFDTRFFLAEASRDAAPVTPDQTENKAAYWATPRRLLDDLADERIKMVRPTQATVMRLAMGHGLADARASARKYPPHTILPVVEEHDGKLWSGVSERHGYPDLDFDIF